VEKGVTWKTGYESLPSNMPRSDKMTEMKCMHEERRRGRAVFLVNNWSMNQYAIKADEARGDIP
jgi:hypothetical protein